MNLIFHFINVAFGVEFAFEVLYTESADISACKKIVYSLQSIISVENFVLSTTFVLSFQHLLWIGGSKLTTHIISQEDFRNKKSYHPIANISISESIKIITVSAQAQESQITFIDVSNSHIHGV